MRYLHLIILLLAVVITAGCVNPEPRFYPNPEIIPTPTATVTTCNYVNEFWGYDSCNGICWDYETQTCCGGIIYNKKFIENVCCGGKLYQYQSGWDCCPNTFLKRWRNDSQDNSQVWYNTSTHHCCAGKVTVSGGTTGWYGTTKQWQDCGNTCYDTTLQTQSCCKILKQEGTEIIAVYSLKDKNKCCEDLPFLIPEDQKCDPTNGQISPKNRTSMGCPGSGSGGGCSQYYYPYLH